MRAPNMTDLPHTSSRHSSNAVAQHDVALVVRLASCLLSPTQHVGVGIIPRHQHFWLCRNQELRHLLLCALPR